MNKPIPNRKNDSGLKILVLGYLIRGPIGGLAWHHLQYIMGLQLMGHDVYFLEDSDDYPSCYNPSTLSLSEDPEFGLKFVNEAFQRLRLGDNWAYYDAHTSSWLGPLGEKILKHCKEADLLLNVSGVNQMRPWLREVPIRVLIDTDPVFTQLRHIQEPESRRDAAKHNVFLSFGENISREGCTVPDDGFPWKPTRQPTVLDAWEVVPTKTGSHFTTVMQWDSYKSRQHNGIEYGMKSKSFDPFMDLPGRTGQVLELALGGNTAPRDLLIKNGWSLRDPSEVASDPWKYQRYIRESKGEFSVAKQGYVVSHSGWFSERSACYLASGRPVVVEDTGCSDWLKCGKGVMTFQSPEEAISALEEVAASYKNHCEAAREIAVEYFDSTKILENIIQLAESEVK